MTRKKVKMLTPDKKRKFTSSKDEEGRFEKEAAGTSGKYSGRWLL